VSARQRTIVVETVQPAILVNSQSLFGEDSATSFNDFNISYRFTDRRVSLVRGENSAWLSPASTALAGAGATSWRIGQPADRINRLGSVVGRESGIRKHLQKSTQLDTEQRMAVLATKSVERHSVLLGQWP
jgi:hypothetical protein